MPRGSERKLTPQQELDVARQYAEGLSVRQIAAVHGVSYTPIAAALKRQGISRRTTADYAWKPTPENRAEVVRLFREGSSVQKIAKAVRTRNEVVSAVLREEGVNARLGGQNHRFKPDQVSTLKVAYEAGVNLSELARQNSCSVTVVRNTLKRAGTEMRPFGHKPKFWTEERLAWLVAQWESGRSQASIAEELGYSQGTVSAKLISLGAVKDGRHVRGKAHGAWKGGRFVDEQGYVRVHVSDDERALAGRTIGGGYVLEHRLAMARFLGRPLTKNETVHHISGDKQDNSPENLQLRQGQHGKGVVIACLDCGSHNVGPVPLT